MLTSSHRADDTLAVAACIALTAIARNVLGQPTPCPQLFDLTEVSAACIASLQSSRSPAVHAEVWSLLAETAPRAEDFDLYVLDPLFPRSCST